MSRRVAGRPSRSPKALVHTASRPGGAPFSESGRVSRRARGGFAMSLRRGLIVKRPVFALLASAAVAAAAFLTLPGGGAVAAGTATGPQQLVTVTTLTPPQSPGGPAP